jgi:hypothetical protein
VEAADSCLASQFIERNALTDVVVDVRAYPPKSASREAAPKNGSFLTLVAAGQQS